MGLFSTCDPRNGDGFPVRPAAVLLAVVSGLVIAGGTIAALFLDDGLL